MGWDQTERDFYSVFGFGKNQDRLYFIRKNLPIHFLTLCGCFVSANGFSLLFFGVFLCAFFFTFEYTSMAWTNMHSPEAALDTFVTTSIAMLGFST